MAKYFYELEIWKEAHALSLKIYKTTSGFPKEERYGITDQLRRASTSVSANIAEGFGRYHYKDKIRFFYTARGSACEVQNFVLFSKDLSYVDKEISDNIVAKYENLNKKINAFIKYLNKQS